jgi:hypothetical protein
MCNTARGRLTRNEEMINSILTNAMHRKLFVLQFPTRLADRMLSRG